MGSTCWDSIILMPYLGPLIVMVTSSVVDSLHIGIVYFVKVLALIWKQPSPRADGIFKNSLPSFFSLFIPWTVVPVQDLLFFFSGPFPTNEGLDRQLMYDTHC
jgi:hypothetical protein